MTTIIAFLVLIGSGAILISYARNDRFAGPRNSAPRIDDLGLVQSHLIRLH
jgi:hypothetical protein